MEQSSSAPLTRYSASSFLGVSSFQTTQAARLVGNNLCSGIPFAEPPVGQLRLKRPVLKTRLDEQIFDARRSGSGCLQPVSIDYNR